MREYKFRGKTCHSNEWRYGSLIVTGETSVHVVETNSEDIVQDGHHLRQDSDRPTWVEPETVGQYTGYTDKNGSEIYEGDIVLDENRQTAYVAWLPQECGFVLVYEKNDSRLGHRNRGSGYSFDENLEIIGNVHDNPDLVSWWNKKKKQIMSGGFFDYQERRISEIADSIEQVILKNKKEKAKEELYPWDYDENGNLYEYSRFYYGFNDETIERFKEAVDLLKRAEIYTHRIDYLLNSDDGEQTFHERLKKDLEKLDETNKI